MLLKLVLIKKKKFHYKIRTKTERNFFIVTAPLPKNSRQRQILINFLKPFERQIIYPEDFNFEGFPAPYPEFEIKCRKMIADFLIYCKSNRPDIAVITPNGLIKEKFYFDLSEYVGKIILNAKNGDNELKSALLAHSGTVLELNTEYDQSKSSVAVLTMPTKK